MTNFEKYRDKIESIMSESGSMAPAVKNGVPVMCDHMIDCNFCDYDRRDGNCWVAFIEWACTECCNNCTSKFECKPRKTRQDELLELYPNIRKWNGVIDICPGDLDKYYHCRSTGPSGEECITCMRDYWLQEVEE